MKLANWTAIHAPKQLEILDPELRFPSFLTEQDILQILSTGNSIFWETNPPEISIFDYAYIDANAGLVYSGANIRPKFVSFHYSGLSEQRLAELKKQHPGKIVLDFLYVAMRID